MTILPDGLDTYVILDDNGNALGWISRSRWRGKWRAVTVKGHLTFHYSRAGAIDAIA